MQESALIGIDGGGTGCRLVLVREDQRFETQGGPCNVSTDLAGALRELSAGLDRLAAQAGMDRAALRNLPACLGLAGVVAGTNLDDISGALRLTNARILDDRAIALRGALGARDGAMVGLGTGSFFALQIDGALRLAGGWGLVLGDEASGGWLGRSALALTLAVVDGFEVESELTATLSDRFGGPSGIIAYALKAQPQDYAKLAPEIVAAADAGDRNGRELMRRGRAYIVTTLEAMGWKETMPLCLTGGLSECYRQFLPEPVRNQIVSPEAPALDGALMLAKDILG